MVFPIIEDHDKTIWIATGNGGLNRFNRESETFTAYKPIAGDPDSLKHLTVLGLHEDSLGNFWVATTNLTDTDGACFRIKNICSGWQQREQDLRAWTLKKKNTCFTDISRTTASPLDIIGNKIMFVVSALVLKKVLQN
ncbi:hypothetical protein QUF70_04970 [Desulfobacterales bacterium HSG17]|nr:hypothetical protein [Desulfobacterales bacterium HSG17]